MVSTDDEDDEAHRTEPSGPLHGEQETLPGAERLLVLVAIVVVFCVHFLCVGEVRKLQQDETCRTQTHHKGQQQDPHRLNAPETQEQALKTP